MLLGREYSGRDAGPAVERCPGGRSGLRWWGQPGIAARRLAGCSQISGRRGQGVCIEWGEPRSRSGGQEVAETGKGETGHQGDAGEAGHDQREVDEQADTDRSGHSPCPSGLSPAFIHEDGNGSNGALHLAGLIEGHDHNVTGLPERLDRARLPHKVLRRRSLLSARAQGEVTLTVDARNLAALRSLVIGNSLSAAIDAAVADRLARQ